MLAQGKDVAAGVAVSSFGQLTASMKKWLSVTPFEAQTFILRLIDFCSGSTRCCMATTAREGFVFKAHRLLYHPTLGLRVIKKKRRQRASPGATSHEKGSRARESRALPQSG